jgi:hypothetical protein
MSAPPQAVEGSSFWSGAPGLLSGFAGVLTAVGGLLAVLFQLGVIGGHSTHKPNAAPTVTVTAKSEPPAAPAPAAKEAPAGTTAAPPAEDDSALWSFRQSIDGLLQNSADTRANIGPLIAAVSAAGGPTITHEQASAQIAEIINQRQSLRNSVAVVPAPPETARAMKLLLASITAALDDDVVVRDWIDARFAGDEARATALWGRQVEASTQATAAKKAFRAEYNTLRAGLGLPPTTVEY